VISAAENSNKFQKTWFSKSQLLTNLKSHPTFCGGESLYNKMLGASSYYTLPMTINLWKK